MDLEQKRIQPLKEQLLKDLRLHLKTTVNDSKELKGEYINNLRVQSVQIKNNNFPVVFFGDGDLHFYEFGNGKNPPAVFKDNEELKPMISQVCRNLGVKTIMISFNRLSVVGVGMIGTWGNLRLETNLFIYRDTGDLLIEVNGWTKHSNIEGRIIKEYELQLDNYSILTEMMAKELAKYIIE
ncbi:MAG: hypothetical protein JXQ90_08655 [Cyclobacteriaceae bacterium]